MFEPIIKLAVDVADAPSYGKSVQGYKPKSEVARDYDILSASVLITFF